MSPHWKSTAGSPTWLPSIDKEASDRFANPTQVACSLFAFTHKVRVKNLPEGQTALGFTRSQLDRLKIDQEVQKLP